MKYFKWVSRLPDANDKVFVVTGANSGTGYETARYLTFKKAKVIMACRSNEKAIMAKEKILSENEQAKIDIIIYDQADFASIDEFIRQLKQKYKTIDGVILNAGIFFVEKGLTTKQKIPLTVGTNYIGVYYLMRQLLNTYRHDNHALRFIFVSSIVSNNHRRLNLKRLMNIDITMYRQYTNSKIAINKLFHVLANGVNLYDFPARGKHVFCLTHPGIANTDIIKNFPAWFRYIAHIFMRIAFQNPEKACLPMVYASIAPHIFNGSYFAPRGLFQISGFPKYTRLPSAIEMGSGQLIYDTGKLIDNISIKENNK
jgi:NAD(P)-dependent dehydrogenase (short-subunit alcohol dehydrogenase family)